MKFRFYSLLASSLLLLLLASCKKDEVKTMLVQGSVPALTVSASTLVLDQANAGNNAVTFSWTANDYGFKAAASYTIQLSKKGSNFASGSTTEISALNSLTKTFTVSDINKELLKIVSAGTASDLEVRIRSDISNTGVAPVYSNVVAMKATPYRDIISYPSVYVPGDYQGWDPGKAPSLASVKNDKTYEGYVNIKTGSLEFKITSDPDWNHTAYGDGGSGKLSTSGGNLKVASAGFYQLKANLNTLTWSAARTAWGILGDATPGGWDTDTDMAYDATTGLWTLTATLKTGEMKFRANRNWDINFGDDNADNAPEYGGSNIKITSAGSYLITLDLSVAGNYSYTLKKS